MERSRDLPRALAPALRRALDVFAVVVIVGPRQVGKSTLVRDPAIAMPGAGAKERLYLTLDDLDLLHEAKTKPDRVLARAPRVTLDEVQRAPELLLAMKRVVDKDRRPGTFLVTGSADVRAMRQVADLLPGRAVYLNLEPMTAPELRGVADDDALETLLTAKNATDARDRFLARPKRSADLAGLVLRGGLPEPALLADADARDLWFAGYVRSWLERGVSDLAAITQLADLKRLMAHLAPMTGGVLNQAQAAVESGLPRTTAHRYLSVLALGLLVDLLPAYSSRSRVRTIKAPKLYWRDTGLLSHLLGLRKKTALDGHPQRDALFENLVLQNLRGFASARRTPPDLFCWRTAGGRDVSFVVEIDDRVIPITVVPDAPAADDARHLEAFLDYEARRAPYGVLLHGGAVIETPAANVVSLPIAMLA